MVRPERAAEAATVSEVIRRAYADVAHSDGREHLMVERLRATPAFSPQLSLVAMLGGACIGHLLLVRVAIGNAAALALAPLSVVPEHHGRCVGMGLVRAAHARAWHLGYGAVVLVGPVGFYARFGYEPLDRYPTTLPVPAPEAMVLQLRPNALHGVSGTVAYPPNWMDH